MGMILAHPTASYKRPGNLHRTLKKINKPGTFSGTIGWQRSRLTGCLTVAPIASPKSMIPSGCSGR